MEKTVLQWKEIKGAYGGKEGLKKKRTGTDKKKN